MRFPWAVFNQGGLHTLVSGGNDVRHTTTLSKFGGGGKELARERARNAESCGERERELTRTSEFIRHSFVHLGQMFSHLDQGADMVAPQERGHCRDLSSNAKPNRPSTLLLLPNTLLCFWALLTRHFLQKPSRCHQSESLSSSLIYSLPHFPLHPSPTLVPLSPYPAGGLVRVNAAVTPEQLTCHLCPECLC